MRDNGCSVVAIWGAIALVIIGLFMAANAEKPAASPTRSTPPPASSTATNIVERDTTVAEAREEEPTSTPNPTENAAFILTRVAGLRTQTAQQSSSSAPASPPTATNTPVPTSTPVPAATPVPTSTPLPTATPESTLGQAAFVVNIVDGDTIDVVMGGQQYRVRYILIDTPEVGTAYAAEATEANRQLVYNKTVYLQKDVSETDRYGRLLRYVFLEDGTFVNAELVRRGFASMATFPPDVSRESEIRQAQSEAVNAGRGLWGSPPEPVAQGCSGGCTSYPDFCAPPIKGNISQTSGEKIYHLPGQAYYDATNIHPAYGERWFCTEQEAVAAGWRKSYR